MNPRNVVSYRCKCSVVRVKVSKFPSKPVANAQPHLTVEFDATRRAFDRSRIFENDRASDGCGH